MKFSKFGEKFCSTTGILELMDDLGKALAGQDKKYMLGGGNPPHIPQVQEIFRRNMEAILNDSSRFNRMIGNYDPPQGNIEFINAFADFLNKQYKWNISSENIAITGGSQAAFFILFNILAGEYSDGTSRKILLPLTPEYIGYADQGISNDIFISYEPQIEKLDKHLFKYHVDFSKLKVTPDISAICFSRPTNPTGNVLTDDEVGQLIQLAKEHAIPLIIDNAYGEPFPHIIFKEVNLKWDENMILVFSLSKLGLPSARNGIIVANKDIVKAVSNANAILSLATTSYGQYLVKPLIENEEIVLLSQNLIKPYYYSRSRSTLEMLYKYLPDNLNWHVHVSEGCLFLWVWFEDLPITSNELYNRLKARNVIIVPGEYFFPGHTKNWKHKNECIRLNYSGAPEDVEAGISILAEEIKRAYT